MRTPNKLGHVLQERLPAAAVVAGAAALALAMSGCDESGYTDTAAPIPVTASASAEPPASASAEPSPPSAAGKISILPKKVPNVQLPSQIPDHGGILKVRPLTLSTKPGYCKVEINNEIPKAVKLDCNVSYGTGTFYLTGNDAGTVRIYGESGGDVENATVTLDTGWCALNGIKSLSIQHDMNFMYHASINQTWPFHMTAEDMKKSNELITKENGGRLVGMKQHLNTIGSFEIPESVASVQKAGMHEAPVLGDLSDRSFAANDCSEAHLKHNASNSDALGMNAIAQ